MEAGSCRYNLMLSVGTSRLRLERGHAEIVEFGGVGCQGLKTEAEADEVGGFSWRLMYSFKEAAVDSGLQVL